MTTPTASVHAEPLRLSPPAPVPAVRPDQAAEQVPLPPEVKARLDSQVGEYVQSLLSLDSHGADFQKRIGAVHTLGNADIQASAGVSNRLLERPVNAMEAGGLGETSVISNGLVQLRQTIDKLDPSRQGDLLSPRRLLGLIPLGSRLLAYFDKYRSAQTHLNAILDALRHGQDELQRDNAAIEQEKQNLWALMEKLRQWVYLGQQLDQAVVSKVASLEASDPERARIAKEEVLFAVRQKVMDLLTQLAVDSQGYLALDMIRRNNLELIKGVDRATTTTVSALRTAVIVAQALANEKLVLDQITALNTTTGNLIEGTARMLQQQSGKIHEQAASSTISLEQLKASFSAVYQTMDEIAAFKVKALDSMSRTVTELGTEVEKARKYLDRVREGEVSAALGSAPAVQNGVVQLLPGTAGPSR